MPPRPTRPPKPCPEDCNCGCHKVVPQTIPFPAEVKQMEPEQEILTEQGPEKEIDYPGDLWGDDEAAETAVEQRETDEVGGRSELDEASSTFIELYRQTQPTEDTE